MTNHGVAGAGFAAPAGAVATASEGGVAKVRRMRRLPGLVSLGLSLLGLLALVVGVAIASPASANETTWAIATVLAWVANILTALGVLLGIAAAILRRGARWGVAGVVIGILSNPFLQVAVFSALS